MRPCAYQSFFGMAWDENGAISTSWSRNQTTRRVDSITRCVRVHTRAFLEWHGTKMGRGGRENGASRLKWLLLYFYTPLAGAETRLRAALIALHDASVHIHDHYTGWKV